MFKYRITTAFLTAILILNIFSIMGLAISAAPPEDNETLDKIYGSTWYAAAGQQLVRSNEKITTQAGMQVNTSGSMDWTNIVHENTAGNIIVQSGGYFNVTGGGMNIIGDFLIDGEVRLVNTTVVMNSSYNGQFRIRISSTGNLTAINTTFTAYDKTTLHHGSNFFRTWGDKYNFTVQASGMMTLIDCDVSFVWGDIINRINGGGIKIFSSDVLIDNCSIYSSDLAGVFVYGNIQPTIINSEIYNNTFSQMLSVIYAKPIIDNNILHSSPALGGWGIYFYQKSDVRFTNNTIYDITWSGIVVQLHSNVTIEDNTIYNCDASGIFLWPIDSPTPITESISAKITDNYIHNNTYGIHSNAESTMVGGISGNISDNLIENNNEIGVFVNNTGAAQGANFVMNSSYYNNTIIDNEAGVLVIRAKPSFYQNNISSNNVSGMYITDRSDIDVGQNSFNYNGHSGIYINQSSKPIIHDNDVLQNDKNGITVQNAQPTISTNTISLNANDGIYLNQSLGTINNVNIIKSNSWNGIGVYNTSSPTITGNKIQSNSKNGILFKGTGGTVNGNNNISMNTENGVAVDGGGRPYIGFSSLYQNSESGVSSLGASPRIVNCNLDGNLKYGIESMTGSADQLENSTITGSGLFDYYINGNSHPVAMNSSYSKSSVSFGDAGSDLRVQWFYFINVTDAILNPLNAVNVNITETSATGTVIWSGITNPMGKSEWINTTVYVQSQSGTTYLPQNYVHADKFVYVRANQGPFSGEKNQYIDFNLDPNLNPQAGIYLSPGFTHNVTPTLRWTAGVDPEGEPLTYRLKIGTSFEGDNILPFQELTTTEYTVTSGIAFKPQWEKDTYHVTITYDDKDGGLNTTHGVFHLMNYAPTRPYVNLTPKAPSILDTITCWINVSSFDNDTDPVDEVLYTYVWSINGEVKTALGASDTTATSLSIKSGDGGVVFKKNDKILCGVTASDGHRTSFQHFDEVILKNIPPSINKTFSDMTIDEDEELIDVFNLYDYFNDPDDYFGSPSTDTLEFRAVFSFNVSVTIDDNGIVDIIPDPNWHGTEIIKFIVEDSDKAFVESFFKLIVNPVNDLPRITKIEGKTVTGSTLSFNIDESEKPVFLNFECEDTDIELGEDDELIYEVDSVQLDVTSSKHPQDPLKGSIKFDADDEQIGNWEFTLKVRDKADNVWDSTVTIKLTITNVNDVPIIRSLEKPGYSYSFVVDGKIFEFSRQVPQAVEGEMFTFIILYSDEDRDETFSIELDDKIRFSYDPKVNYIPKEGEEEYKAVEIQFTPSENDIGLVSINITVRDRAHGSDTVQVMFFVENVNDPPTALIYSPNTKSIYAEGIEIFFNGDAVDPDTKFGEVLNYSWSSDRDGLLGNEKELRIPDLSVGWHKITFTVTDKDGLQDAIEIELMINTPDDTDADGLLDDWELDYFTDLEQAGPGDDPDGDGFTNIQEFREGTNPIDPASYPQEKKGEVDDSIIMYAIILAVVAIIIALSIFLFIFKTSRKKEVVGWSWISDTDREIGAEGVTEQYVKAQQVQAAQIQAQAQMQAPTQQQLPELPPVEPGTTEDFRADEAVDVDAYDDAVSEAEVVGPMADEMEEEE
jgi:parallel beta-helix repeat protein